MLLMEAGGSIPQHFELAILYSRSKELQTYIIEYFIVVVQMCHRFYAYSQKSTIMRLASSLDDTDLKDYRLKVVTWSKCIREEIDLLVASRVEHEAQENSNFRGSMIQASDAAIHQERLASNREYLDSVSANDYETAWRQVRKKGNTRSYARAPEYSAWRSRSDSGTLVFSDKLGSGKSVVLANVVDDLVLQVDSKVAAVAYSFCKHDVPESVLANTVIGALFRQILTPVVSSGQRFGLHADGLPSQIDSDFMVQDLQRVIPNNYKIYFVLDGMDLCSLAEQALLSEQLQNLQYHFKLLICVSQRQEPHVRKGAFDNYFPDAIHAPLPDNASEIESFITSELECYLSDGTLALGDPALILDIHQALLTGSQGMFLWVALQIQSLRVMRTDAEIRYALRRLPRDLSEIYDQLVQRSGQPGQAYQQRLFTLVIAAKRPLTVDEMREALSVTPGDTVWNASKMINDVYSVLQSCGCLIAVDEEENTIRTIHPSVDQFLLKPLEHSEKSQPKVAFTATAAQDLMISIICTYLDYGVFNTSVAVQPPKLELGAAPANIMRSTFASSSRVQGIAMKLLRTKTEPAFDASEIARTLKAQKPLETIDYRFLHYAKTFAFEHAHDAQTISMHDFKTLVSQLKYETTRNTNFEKFISLLELGYTYDNEEMIRFLCETGRLWDAYRASPATNKAFGNLFRLAIEVGHSEAAIGFILSCVESQDKWEDSFPGHKFPVTIFLGPSAVQHVIELHRNRGLESLIDINQEVHRKWESNKPIFWALKDRNLDAIHILLDSGKLLFEVGEIQLLESETMQARELNSQDVIELVRQYRLYN